MMQLRVSSKKQAKIKTLPYKAVQGQERPIQPCYLLMVYVVIGLR